MWEFMPKLESKLLPICMSLHQPFPQTKQVTKQVLSSLTLEPHLNSKEAGHTHSLPKRQVEEMEHLGTALLQTESGSPQIHMRKR